MHQPVPARQEFHERAEFLDRDHPAAVNLADLRLERRCTSMDSRAIFMPSSDTE